MVAVMELN